MTNEQVASLCKALWPLYTNGEQVEIERVKRAPGCAAVANVLYNTDAGRWHVLIDEALTPSETLHYIGHELGHAALGHSKKDGNAVMLAACRNVFEHGQAAVMIMPAKERWAWKAGNAEAIAKEEEADQFAAKFVADWQPVLDVAEQAGRKALQNIMGR